MKRIKRDTRDKIYRFGSDIIEALPKRWLFRTFPFIYDRALAFRTESYVKRGDTVVQVGMNMNKGVRSNALLMARAVGIKGTVLVIEPDPQNISLLKRYIKKVGLKNIIVAEKAVWNKKKKMSLMLGKAHRGWNRLEEVPITKSMRHFAYHDRFLAKTSVQADTIDSIIKESGIKGISHINITINGAEFEALQGMKNTLNDNQHMSVLVVHHKARPILGQISTSKRIGMLLKDYGYHVKVGKRWIIGSR